MEITKEDRIAYGITGQPHEAQKVLVKGMEFDHTQIETRSWMLINGNKVAFVNSYDGNLGRKQTVIWRDYDPENKKTAKKLREYAEVDMTKCPFAIPVDATE